MAEAFVGEIKMFGFNFAPRSYAFCDGQLISISQNTALFSLLGTIYGGDGRTTFQLPDLRGRNPMAFGTGLGLTSRPIGARFGSENVTITENQMPAHTHGIKAASNAATKPAAAEGDFLASHNPRTGEPVYISAAGATNTVNLGGGNSAGGGQSVSIMNPTLALNFSICLLGIFPSRN